MQPSKKPPIHILVCIIALSIFACRPVIAIGWNEFLILSILIMVLLGPPLYKLIRRVEKFWKHKLKDK